MAGPGPPVAEFPFSFSAWIVAAPIPLSLQRPQKCASQCSTVELEVVRRKGSRVSATSGFRREGLGVELREQYEHCAL